jgi:hypothetical protein
MGSFSFTLPKPGWCDVPSIIFRLLSLFSFIYYAVYHFGGVFWGFVFLYVIIYLIGVVCWAHVLRKICIRGFNMLAYVLAILPFILSVLLYFLLPLIHKKSSTSSSSIPNPTPTSTPLKKA